jgi:hypothetical protein
MDTPLVYDPVTNDWWSPWVLSEERDRRRGVEVREPFRRFKRLMASSRSS